MDILELLHYTFFQHALLGSLFASIACGIIGTYIVTRRLVFISKGTPAKRVTRAMVAPGVRDRKFSREVHVEQGEKSFVYIQGARTANRHR